MPDIEGEELAPLIIKSYPQIRILVMTGFDTTHFAKSMLEKGALGYLLKNAGEDALKEAIERVYNREQYIDPFIKSRLIDEAIFPQKQAELRPSLTRREKDILKLIMEEKTS